MFLWCSKTTEAAAAESNGQGHTQPSDASQVVQEKPSKSGTSLLIYLFYCLKDVTNVLVL